MFNFKIPKPYELGLLLDNVVIEFLPNITNCILILNKQKKYKYDIKQTVIFP
jgi:hypothetical protein